jgi:hypothetical protein
MTILRDANVNWIRSIKMLLAVGLVISGVKLAAASDSHVLKGSETYDEEIIVVADGKGELHRVKPMKDGHAVFEKMDPLAIGSKAFDLPEYQNRSGGSEYQILPGRSVSIKTPTGEWRELKLGDEIPTVGTKIEKDGVGNLYVTGQNGIASYYRLGEGKLGGAFGIYLSQSVGGKVIGTAAIPDGSGMLVLNEDGTLFRVPMPPAPNQGAFFPVEKLASGIQKIESTGSHVLIFKRDGNWGFAPPDHALHSEQSFSKNFVALNSLESYPLRSRKIAAFSNQNPGIRKSIKDFLASRLHLVTNVSAATSEARVEVPTKVLSEARNEVPSEVRNEIRNEVASEMEEEIRPGIKPGFMIRPASPSESSQGLTRPKATQFGVTADPNAPEFRESNMDSLLSEIKLQVCLHIGRAPGVDRKRPWQRRRSIKKKPAISKDPTKLN